MGPAQPLKVVAALLVITVTIYQLAEVNSFCHKVTNEEIEKAPESDDGRRGVETPVPSRDRKSRTDAFEGPNPTSAETEEKVNIMFKTIPDCQPCVKCIISKINVQNLAVHPPPI